MWAGLVVALPPRQRLKLANPSIPSIAMVLLMAIELSRLQSPLYLKIKPGVCLPLRHPALHSPRLSSKGLFNNHLYLYHLGQV